MDYQTSNELTGRLNRDRDVLWRGRASIMAFDNGPMGIYAPYFYGQWNKDIEFLNAGALRPEVDVWYAQESELVPGEPYERHLKCPMTLISPGNGDIDMYVTVAHRLIGGSKATGFTLRVSVAVWSRTQQTEPGTYFVTVFNRTVATSDGSLYPETPTD